MRSLLLAMLLALATLTPATARASDFTIWEQSDHRATNVARTGLIVSGIGLGLSVSGVGLLVGSNEELQQVGAQLAIVGQTALYVGPPLLAGGSLRARRALNELGAGGPGRIGGTVAWTLWAVSLAVPGTVIVASSSDPSSDPGSMALYGVWASLAIGSVVAGGLQMQDNARYRLRLPPTARRGGNTFVWLAPAMGPRGTGLRLFGVF